jgi:hypothetical protein
MNDTFELRGGESHIEVHKFFPGAVVGIAVLSLVLQRIFLCSPPFISDSAGAILPRACCWAHSWGLCKTA